MDETVLRTLLFDFYGELLTEKQRECYDLHYNQDLSLQEIAEHYGATRQAVWDLVRRAEAALRDIEGKTGLVARSVRRRRTLEEVTGMISSLPEFPEKRSVLDKLSELGD